MSTLSVDDVRRFLTAAKDSPYYAPFVTLLWTGARRGEVLALRWLDIDLLLGTISITRSMYVARGAKIAFEEPKSQMGRRQVAMPPSLAIVLREHHKRMEQLRGPLNDKDLVFTWEDGRPMLPDSVTRAFKRIARRLGLDGIHLHSSRHSHAILMLEQGINPKRVSERLGQANIGITLDIYSHIMPGIQQAAAETLDKALANALLANGSVDKTQTAPLTNG
jgi:integrase